MAKIKKINIFLILLAAGDSKRLKSYIPKPYYTINNKTLLEHSLNSFKPFPQVKKTIIVYNKKHKKYLNKLKLNNAIKILGGNTRQESTFKALRFIKKMNCDKVIIHDVARPNPTKRLLTNIIYHLTNKHAVAPVLKVSDATKRVRKDKIFKNIKRNTLRLSQTPQGFTFKKLYSKHAKNKNITFDDDLALFINDQENVFTIPGSKKNLKITDKEDLEIFRSLKKSKMFFGIAFDVHRLAPKRKLFLAGINIKSKLGTLGHSDGDPVLHSIIDAILGACKLGDIGEKFSDKSKKFKNIRSTILLNKVIKETQSKGFFINNIDINIIAQTPKIKNYKKKMINSISNLCGVSKNQINIKGKTTEKLGVIGKELAIAAETIVSVIQYD